MGIQNIRSKMRQTERKIVDTKYVIKSVYPTFQDPTVIAPYVDHINFLKNKLRSLNIAYGIFKGRNMSQMEANRKSNPIWTDVINILYKERFDPYLWDHKDRETLEHIIDPLINLYDINGITFLEDTLNEGPSPAEYDEN